MRIDVLPLRKLPSSVAVLSYDVDEPVVVGQLVTVPFRRRAILGIVWNTASRYTERVERVTTVHEMLLLNSVQRSILEATETTHAVSISSLLTQHFPADRVLRSIHVQQPHGDAPKSSDILHWYNDRPNILDDLHDAVHKATPLVILVPTLTHAEEWKKCFPDAPIVSSAMKATERNRIYRGVADGSIQRVIGMADALFLPYPTWPTWILDDEEHQSHKQSQAPYLDVRRVLEMAPGAHIWLSAAPTLRRYRKMRPDAPTRIQRRSLGRLDQGTNAPWVSWEAESAIRESSLGSQIVWMMPRNNFAVRFGCTNCGWSMGCSVCGNSLRWSSPHGGTATCSFCKHVQSLPSMCERCRQPGLRSLGLTIDSFRESVAQLFPDRQQSMHYCAYFADLPAQADLVIHVSGDALLQFPDVAAEDRTYHMIQSLASRFPSAHHIVQTYEPSFRLWALWATQQDATWYQALWQERVDLHIPPGIPGMLARYRGSEGYKKVREKKAELEQDTAKHITCLILPIQRRSATHTEVHRLLLTCTDHVHPATRVQWRTTFPHPWAVDMAPDSWLV